MQAIDCPFVGLDIKLSAYEYINPHFLYKTPLVRMHAQTQGYIVILITAKCSVPVH